jgi:hypothetical protein
VGRAKDRWQASHPCHGLSTRTGALVGRFHEAEQMTTTRKSKELVHEGKYAAEIDIELDYSDESWSPTMSADDARKLDAVRLALRSGNIAEAAKYGRVFELTPVTAK